MRDWSSNPLILKFQSSTFTIILQGFLYYTSNFLSFCKIGWFLPMSSAFFHFYYLCKSSLILKKWRFLFSQFFRLPFILFLLFHFFIKFTDSFFSSCISFFFFHFFFSYKGIDDLKVLIRIHYFSVFLNYFPILFFLAYFLQSLIESFFEADFYITIILSCL